MTETKITQKHFPFRWKFDVFEFGVLHSDGHNVFATILLHDDDTIANGAQRIGLHASCESDKVGREPSYIADKIADMALGEGASLWANRPFLKIDYDDKIDCLDQSCRR